MKRTILVFAILVLSLIGVVCPARALELSASQQEAIRVAMADMFCFDEDYYGDDVSVSLLRAGQPVPMYRHAKDGSVEMTGVLYPIVYDGRYVAGCYEYPDGTMSLQKNMALQIQSCIDKTGYAEIAIICEASGMYLTDGSSVTLLSAPDEPEVAKEVLSATNLGLDGLDQLELANLNATTALNYDGEPEGLQGLVAEREKTIAGAQVTESHKAATQQSDTSQQTDSQITGNRLSANWCSMDYVDQPQGSHICWAACLSMLYGFYGHPYYSAVDVAIYYHFYSPHPVYYVSPPPDRPFYDYMRDGDWVAYIISSHLLLGIHSHHLNEILPYSTIKGYIDYQCPIIGGFKGYIDIGVSASGGRHMNVIKGYNNGSIILNDSLYGENLPATPFSYNNTVYWIYPEYSNSLGCFIYMTQVGDIRYDC